MITTIVRMKEGEVDVYENAYPSIDHEDNKVLICDIEDAVIAEYSFDSIKDKIEITFTD